MANKVHHPAQAENSRPESIKTRASAVSGAATQIHQESVPLICLPFAGAGPSFFTEWNTLTSGLLEIIAVQLPGREKRFVEEPYRDAVMAVMGILPEIQERVGDSGPVVIFGHSLGAILGYELAHQLAERTEIGVAHLLVSGSPGPWTQRKQRATGLDNQAFLDQVREFAGYDHPALNDPDLQDMLLPVLRADVEMHENYRPAWNHPLPILITSVRGTHDELVTREEAAQWQSATTMPLQLAELAGGHMYLTTSAGKLLGLIEDIISWPASAAFHPA